MKCIIKHKNGTWSAQLVCDNSVLYTIDGYQSLKDLFKTIRQRAKIEKALKC